MKTEHAEALRKGIYKLDLSGDRVLLVIPDGTRTVPVGEFIKIIWPALRGRVKVLDVIIALGTHQPMSEEAINRHLDLTPAERSGEYREMDVANHVWDDPDKLSAIGTISAEEMEELTEGRLAEPLDITITKRIFDYDRVLILSPVFPHELVGMSGGYKYFFPGISGPGIIDLTHWLAALTGNLKTIGKLDTPFRRVVNAASRFVSLPTHAICTVIHNGEVDGVWVGDVLESWEKAAKHAQRTHVVRKPRMYHSVLACPPTMYEDLWTGGKSIYKVEPVIEPGGEITVYAPHITSLSVTHEHHLLICGYHCSEYFQAHLDELSEVPRGVLGVASYICGTGSYDGVTERPRMKVKLATGIPRETVEAVGFEYVDPDSIDIEAWRDREEEGILLVERAGETLYRLENDQA